MIETGVPVVLFDPVLTGTGSLEPDNIEIFPKITLNKK
jgi:hypothetical protein